ncbi:MAG: hypothetical protein EPO65_12260 [Dehalococcoidia bacterium]|nr:MAG: hypothetical protein EPO65_12260 [Dehalococcoidia bacterium]
MREMRAGTVTVGMVCAVVLAACGGGSSTPTPAATAEPTAPAATAATPSATAMPSRDAVVAEVSQAYLAYWDAYADAVLHLDITRVERFVSGAELASIREEIEKLRADGVALRVVVEHDFAVIDVTGAVALVEDQIVDNTFYVDAKTLEPPTAAGSGDRYRDLVRLERLDGRWTVTSGARNPR